MFIVIIIVIIIIIIMIMIIKKTFSLNRKIRRSYIKQGYRALSFFLFKKKKIVIKLTD